MYKSALARLSGMVLLAVISCASAGTVRPEDVFERREGALPFALRFPAGSEKSGKGIASLEAKDGKSVNELWILARHYHLAADFKGRVEKVHGLYQIIISADGSAVMARNNLGCLLSEMGRHRDAENMLQEIISGNSPLITAYYNLYVLYAYSHREGDAMKTLLLMRERFPENIYASVEIGNIFFERGNYREAEKYYGEGLQHDKENPVPLHKMALLKEKTGNFTEAELYYARCIREFPYFHSAYTDYAGLLLKLERKNEARSVIKAGLKILEK
jgi:tetratricopeptide (TPR) repeat protein